MKIQDLREATTKYTEIRNRTKLIIATINPVEMVTPVNLGEVKSNWIENSERGVFINPVFHYDYAALIREVQKLSMLEGLKADLSAIPPATKGEKFIYSHLMDVLEDAVHTLKAFEAIIEGDDKTSAKYFLMKYGQPDNHTYWLALNLAEHGIAGKSQRVVQLSPEDTKLLGSAHLNADFIKQMFIWAMEQYGEPWPVEIQASCTAIDVRDKNSLGTPIIAIPADKHVSGFKLAELIGHEIESHWLGSKNAELIGLLKLDSELIYEGAAKMKDYQFGANFLGEATMPKPYYIIAERQALLGYSFAEVGKNLTGLLDGNVKRAWGFTYRTFRGITDTTNRAGYAFTKDRAYLEGFIFCSNLAQTNPGLLSFSTLEPTALNRLNRLLDRSEFDSAVVKDQHIGEAALREILRRIKTPKTP